MCLAIPGKILSTTPSDQHVRLAQVSFGGIIKDVNLEMVTEAKLNDYVLVHVGVAISIVKEEEAQRVFEYLKEMGELTDLDDQP